MYYSKARSREVDAYISKLTASHPLPEFTSGTEKQIAYATSLRNKFIEQRLYDNHVDMDEFFRLTAQLRFEALDDEDREKAKAGAEKAGQTVDEWLANYRAKKFVKWFHLYFDNTVELADFIFTETDAAKVIDRLAYGF